jgi:hypothetical protein
LRGYHLIVTDTLTSKFIQVMLSGFQNDPQYFHSDMGEVIINDLPFLREYGRISAASNTGLTTDPSASPATPAASPPLVHFFVYACATPKGLICFIATDSEPYNKETLSKLEASVMTARNPAY